MRPSGRMRKFAMGWKGKKKKCKCDKIEKSEWRETVRVEVKIERKLLGNFIIYVCPYMVAYLPKYQIWLYVLLINPPDQWSLH